MLTLLTDDYRRFIKSEHTHPPPAVTFMNSIQQTQCKHLFHTILPNNAIISLNSLHKLVSAKKPGFAFCEVQTEFCM